MEAQALGIPNEQPQCASALHRSSFQEAVCAGDMESLSHAHGLQRCEDPAKKGLAKALASAILAFLIYHLIAQLHPHLVTWAFYLLA